VPEAKDHPFTIVQLVAINETGDSYYRMRWPARELAAQRPNWRIINLDARAQERFQWSEEADLLVTYQSHDLDLIPLIQKRRAAGKKTLVEYNDNFYFPPAASPVADAWNSPLVTQSYERFMTESDAIIVTGEGLKELFSSRFEIPVHILRNHLPRETSAFDELWEEPSREIRIGVAGSLGHMSDYMAITSSLRALFKKFPAAVLHVMGNESLPSIIGLPPERIRFTPWGSMEEYFNFLRPLHLGLAPLLNTPYNRCRSDVKALEIAGAGTLPLLPRLLPYDEFLNETGIPSYGSLEELFALASEYLSEPKRIREQAERCHRYVSEKRIGPRQGERLELYSAFLPAQPGQFVWPTACGYQELSGISEEHTRENRLLRKIQEHAKSNTLPAILAEIQAELSRNPYLPGLALAELKMLSSSLAGDDWSKLYEKRLSFFPVDLRFPLLRIQHASATELLALWTHLHETLAGESPAYREFFESIVIGVFAESLKRNSLLLSLGEALLEFYPDSALLRAALANGFEEVQKFDEACVHCQWLVRAKEAALKNEKSLSRYDRNFLKTWLESLAARLK